MRWVLTRNGQHARCEVTRDDANGQYRIVVTTPDRSESVENLDRPTDLIERTVAMMRELHDDGWRIA